MGRGPLILERGRTERSAWLRLLIWILLDRLRLWRVSKCGERALANGVWCLDMLRRGSGRVRRILLEARRHAALVHLVGRRRLLLESMAHRSATWCTGRMGGVGRILLAGMCHRALRWVLWEGILARRSM
jgi:hypothetical protein